MEKETTSGKGADDQQYGSVTDRNNLSASAKGAPSSQSTDKRKKRQAVIATSASQRTLTLGKITKAAPLTAKVTKKRPPLAHSKDSKPPKQPLTRR